MDNLEPMDIDRLIMFCKDVGLDAAEVLREACINKLRGVKLVKVPRGVVLAPVVLCRYCKYWDPHYEYCEEYATEKGAGDFCSCGERKDG